MKLQNKLAVRKADIMEFQNFTPHAINLTDGRVFESVGCARVSTSYTEFVDDICTTKFGEVQGLPEPVEGVCYIVSAIVKAACPDRNDLVCPCTNHKDAVRENGQIKSVPGFSR